MTELDKLGDELEKLGKRFAKGAKNIQPTLSITGQRWYRGARELLVLHNFEDLLRFDRCFRSGTGLAIEDFITLLNYDHGNEYYRDRSFAFASNLLEARGLLHGAFEELKSRELALVSQLSFEIATDEFEAAGQLLNASSSEPVIRAAGVVARIALERHLFTVADSRSIAIQVNPPTKKKADVSDLLSTFVKTKFITTIQRSELDWAFKVGNNCAHPQESVNPDDVARMIKRSKELASVII